ncbi:MAG TPA: hypothetical protein VFZ97_18745 [Acidimicrobiales bacterium]
MPKFLFVIRRPQGYIPGEAGTIEALNAWFEGMGENRVDPGHGVVETRTLGSTEETTLGGYFVVAADDLQAAELVAKDCPFLGLGGGIEVGLIGERPPATTRT